MNCVFCDAELVAENAYDFICFTNHCKLCNITFNTYFPDEDEYSGTEILGSYNFSFKMNNNSYDFIFYFDTYDFIICDNRHLSNEHLVHIKCDKILDVKDAMDFIKNKFPIYMTFK